MSPAKLQVIQQHLLPKTTYFLMEMGTMIKDTEETAGTMDIVLLHKEEPR